MACITFASLAACGGSQPLPRNTPGAISTPGMQRPSSASGYRVLFSFGRKGDGARGIYPFAGLIDVRGKLYGTTGYGGKSGAGTVFGITHSGKEKVLHDFKGSDGSYPDAALLAVGDTLYGTTAYGGANGYGTVFAIGTNGSGFRLLYSFAGGGDGAYPMAGLMNVGDKLYGTTYQGGAYAYGTVFSIDTSGTENIVHSFAGDPDGANPLAALTNVDGALYGTTAGGGHGAGTVFSIDASDSEDVLYAFKSPPDAEGPEAPLIVVNGTLYGTTHAGGSADWGAVFSISTTGANESVLHSFSNNGADGIEPMAPLTDLKGTFYGTTYEGGAASYGTVFSITTSGNETILHSFGQNYSNDGAYPTAGLIAVKRTLYGTTYSGGFSQPSPSCSYGCYWGTVFALRP